jgi:hypothetical protein
MLPILFYADAKNCGELKKEALYFLTEHIDEAVERRSIGQLYQSESLTNELMLTMSKRARLTNRRNLLIKPNMSSINSSRSKIF